MSVKWCRKSWTESGGLFLLERPELVGRGQPDKSNLHCQQIFTFLLLIFVLPFLKLVGGAIYILNNVISIPFFFNFFFTFFRGWCGEQFIFSTIFTLLHSHALLLLHCYFLYLELFGEQFGYFL